MEVSHLSGASLLSAADKARVARRLRAAARDAEQRHLGPPPPGSRETTPLPSAPPQRKKRHPEEYAARGTEGRHAAAAQARAHEHPGDARFSLTPGEGASPERAARIRAKYDEMHVDELKEVLKANEQLLSGAKAVLEERCTEPLTESCAAACPPAPPAAWAASTSPTRKAARPPTPAPATSTPRRKPSSAGEPPSVELYRFRADAALRAQPVREQRGGAHAVGHARRRRAGR
jgi:hypothetical protein